MIEMEHKVIINKKGEAKYTIGIAIEVLEDVEYNKELADKTVDQVFRAMKHTIMKVLFP